MTLRLVPAFTSMLGGKDIGKLNSDLGRAPGGSEHLNNRTPNALPVTVGRLCQPLQDKRWQRLIGQTFQGSC